MVTVRARARVRVGHQGVAHLAHPDVSELILLLRDRRHLGRYGRRISRAAHLGDLRISLAPRRAQLAQGAHGPPAGGGGLSRSGTLQGSGLVDTEVEVTARPPSSTLSPKLGQRRLVRIVRIAADEVAARTRGDAQPGGAMGASRAPIWLELHNLAAAQIVHLRGEIAHCQRERERLVELLECAAARQQRHDLVRMRARVGVGVRVGARVGVGVRMRARVGVGVRVGARVGGARARARARARVRSGMTLIRICCSIVRLASRTCSTLCEVATMVAVARASRAAGVARSVRRHERVSASMCSSCFAWSMREMTWHRLGVRLGVRLRVRVGVGVRGRLRRRLRRRRRLRLRLRVKHARDDLAEKRAATRPPGEEVDESWGHPAYL
jgi:hypothetical protein